jgi:hypothetical protein
MLRTIDVFPLALSVLPMMYEDSSYVSFHPRLNQALVTAIILLDRDNPIFQKKKKKNLRGQICIGALAVG